MLRWPLALLLAALGVTSLAQTALADSRPTPRFITVEAKVMGASAPLGTTVFEGGFSGSYIGEFLEISLGLAATSAPLVTGRRDATAVVPRVGAHLSFGDRGATFQPYVAAQVASQFRSGAELADERGMAVGIECGARLMVCGNTVDDWSGAGVCFGVAFGVLTQLQVSDYLLGPALLPAGSSLVAVPASLIVGGRF